MCLEYDLILNDILFWLNDPYSQQMNSPFISGYIIDRCINIIKKLNPDSIIHIPFNDYGIFLNSSILGFFCKNGKIKQKNNKIDINILDNLSNNQLKDLYLYNINKIKLYDNKDIIDISLKFINN